MNTKYRIVVGVDGSPAGTAALRWAAHTASTSGGTVEAVTAFAFAGPNLSDLRYRGEQRRQAERRLADEVAAAAGEAPGVEVHARLETGPPAVVLVDAARGADLLVLGDRGAGRLTRAVLGSVVERCVRTAACPVVVVPVAAAATRSAAAA